MLVRQKDAKHKTSGTYEKDKVVSKYALMTDTVYLKQQNQIKCKFVFNKFNFRDFLGLLQHQISFGPNLVDPFTSLLLEKYKISLITF